MRAKVAVVTVCVIVAVGLIVAVAVTAQGQPRGFQGRRLQRVLLDQAGEPAITYGGDSVYVVYAATLFRFDAETLEELSQAEMRPEGFEMALDAAVAVGVGVEDGRLAREASLRAHLQELRNVIGLYQAQCGDYPARLTDIMATAAPPAGGNGVAIDPADFRGPYITQPDMRLPNNPITRHNVDGIDWVYTPETGRLISKAGGAVYGTDYGTW